MWMKALLGSVATLVFAAAMISMPAQAQHEQDCRERIDRAGGHLSHMLHRFGPRSGAVRDARFDLQRIRDMCFRRNWHDGGGRHEWRGREERDHTWHGDRRGPHH